MKWLIPAKTFLLGEYAALAEQSAILLTTTPCFEVTLTKQQESTGIHPESPAGLWWQAERDSDHNLSFADPYSGRGGLGASSAQFLGSYLASCQLHDKSPQLNAMLHAYYQSAWNGTGLKPSGYDVIAQSQQGCVFINKQKKIIQSYPWPFHDLSFLLLHTGKKLATHHHLQETALPFQIDELSALVDIAKQAFDEANSQKLIQAINSYHQNLMKLDLVAPHSMELIASLRNCPEVLAIKGCGALGSDVLLLISSRQDAAVLKEKLLKQNWSLLATEENLTKINTHLLLPNNL